MYRHVFEEYLTPDYLRKDKGDKHVKLLEFLKSKEGEKIEEVDLHFGATNSEETSLMYASRFGKIELVRYLAKAGADLDRRYKNKYEDRGTALIRSARRGDIKTMRVLLGCGADVEAKNGNGESVLAVLIFTYEAWLNYNNVPISKMLIKEYNARTDIMCDELTAIHAVATRDHCNTDDLLKVLLDNAVLLILTRKIMTAVLRLWKPSMKDWNQKSIFFLSTTPTLM